MRYKLFGRTGLRVAELCLGAMTFGEDWGWGAAKDECARILDAYAEAGGNFIDTANFYTDGTSERIVGELVAPERDRWVVATKYALNARPGDPNAGGSQRKSLTRALDASLERLRTDYIDVYWVHVWDVFTPVEEVVRALDDAVRAGKVLYVGISDTPAWLVSQAVVLADLRGWTRFAGLQVPYSLVWRDVERDLLPMAQALDLAVTAWGPLGSGLLTGRYGSDRARPDGTRIATTEFGGQLLSERNLSIADALNSVAAERGARPAQVAIAWVRAQQRNGVLMPIVGARRLEQIKDILGAVDIDLAEDELEQLDAVSRIELGFPHDFPGRAYAYGNTFHLGRPPSPRRLHRAGCTAPDRCRARGHETRSVRKRMGSPVRVEFMADGVRLVGHLHVPDGGDNRPAAGVVIAIPGPSVKEQVGDRYGRLLSDRGFACLAFDPRNYGESGGEPRQREDTFGKLVDLQGAVTFLRHQDGVDPERIAALGISIGAGYALRAAAFDPRIKAFIGIAGYYPSPHFTRAATGDAAFRDALAAAIAAVEARDSAQETAYLPVVAREGETAALAPGPLANEFAEYYLTRRGGHPRFQNRLTCDSAYLGLLSDTAMAADFLSPTPALIIHGENDMPPSGADAARALFDRLGQPKRLLMLDTRGHIDLYDVDEFVGAAVSSAAEFLDEHFRATRRPETVQSSDLAGRQATGTESG